THPSIGKNSNTASEVPEVRIPMARGLRLLVKISDVIDVAGAIAVASPAPMRNRVAASCQTLETVPVRIVIPLQNARPRASRLRRLERSAIRANGMPTKE